ncbi:MAG: MMPL family transporter [Salibacteraceae bacterium]
MSQGFARFIIATIIVLTGLSLYQITKLTFDYEFEHFFPTDDSELEFYQSYKDKFDTDIDFVIMGVKNEGGIFDEDFLTNSQAMIEEVEEIRHIKRVISPFNAADYALGPFGPIAIPYLHPNDPDRYTTDSTRIYKNQKQVGSLFSPDGKSMSMLLIFEDTLNKVETDSVYYDLMDVIGHYEFDEIHAAGKAIGQAFYIEQIRSEFVFFILIAILLIVITLILIYRSFWGVFVPLTVVLLSVIWLLGLMSTVGKSIDIMTTLLPLVIFVVGISDVIHLLSRFFEEIRAGLPKMEAIKTAYKRVGAATFLTSLTTALGFLTLLTSGVRPVRELGLFAAAGVFLAFILAFSLLPAILTLSKVPKLAYKEPSTVMWNKLVIGLFRFSLSNRIKVITGSVIIVLVALFGISQIRIDNFLLEDVPEDDPIRESFVFFEENFAGVRPFELQFSMIDSNSSLLSDQAIEDMVRVETYLIDSYGVGFLNSPLNIIRSANQALNGGLDTAYVIPDNAEDLQKAKRLILRLSKRPEFSALITGDKQHGRFSGKIEDLGGRYTAKLDKRLVNHFEKYPLSTAEIELTGMSRLIDKNNETLSSNMMSGLLFALLVVAIIIGFLFKSWRIAMISLVPNILPLLVIGGFMGLTGIDLKISTSVIFGIAFGIAVDDSIHYLIKYRQELQKGRSTLYALKRTSLSTGKAIILTTIILCMGFIALSTSDFTSTFYVGILISMALASAVVADLILLPIMLLPKARKS